MLSLANAFSENDLENFEKRILNYLNKTSEFKILYSAEPKIDGISASLIYKDGEFVQGLSRERWKRRRRYYKYLSTID